MTNEEINIECAKLDGWTCVLYTDGGTSAYWEKNGLGDMHINDFSYTTSHDAILPVIHKILISPELRRDFMLQLMQLQLIGELSWFFEASPLQLATALLKATNKWKE